MVHRHPIGAAVLLPLEATVERRLNVIEIKCTNGGSWNRIVGRLKDRVNHTTLLVMVRIRAQGWFQDNLRRCLQLVEVEGIIAGNGAVEAGLYERCPSIVELVRTAFIVLADACHSRINCGPAVHRLHGVFAEEKVDELLVLQRAYEVRLVQLAQVVLLRALWLAVNQRVAAGKVRNSARVQLTIWKEG